MDSDDEKRLNELLEGIPPEKAISLIRTLVRTTIGEFAKTIIPQTIEVAIHELGHSVAVTNAVDEIANETGDTAEDVLLKALSLYEAAIEAKRRNQRLVVVGPDYRFAREIVGFDQSVPEAAERTAAGAR